jgi:(4-alkanoyl-5-oxo-2,5-dihydrofuran-3-yl)methyl phosphate reductase
MLDAVYPAERGGDVEARLGIFRAIRAGRLASVTTNVASILGREPITFGRWAAQNAAAFG